VLELESDLVVVQEQDLVLETALESDPDLGLVLGLGEGAVRGLGPELIHHLDFLENHLEGAAHAGHLAITVQLQLHLEQ